MTRHIARMVLLAGLLVVGSIAVPAAGAVGAGHARPAEPQTKLSGTHAMAANAQRAPLDATIEMARVPGKTGWVEVTATYTHRVSTGFEIRLPKGRNVTVLRTNGFNRTAARTYRWSGSVSDPSITYQLDPNESVPLRYASGRRYTSIDAGNWSLVRGSYVSPRHNNNVRPNWWDGQEYATRGSGVVVGDFVYAGPYSQRTRTARGQRFRVVVTHPARGVPRTPAQSPYRIDSSVAGLLDTMENVSTDLTVGERDPNVTVLVGPTQVSPSEAEEAGYLLSTGLYAPSNTTVFNTGTAIHEYVHTRQNFTDRTVARSHHAGRQTHWLTEAQAQYYQHLYACREGRITSAEFKKRLRRGQTTGPVLANKSTWPTQNVEYEKGALVLSALDVEIRNRTGGRRTLQDVFRRLNGHRSEINHSVLEDTVASVAGTRMDGFLKQYVRGSAAPSVPTRTACNRRRTPSVGNVGPGVSGGAGTLSSLQVSDRRPRAGERLLVDAEIRRTGTGLAGPRTQTAALLVNGSVVQRKSVSVSPGQPTPVAFTTRFPTPGERHVTIALLKGGQVRDTLPDETVSVRRARVPVRFNPARNTTAPGTSETYELTVGDVPNGVGRYRVDLRVDNGSVANVTGVTVVGGSGTTRLGPNGRTAHVDASGLDTPNGTVTVARVTLAGRNVGRTNVSTTVHALGDESGNDYAVASTREGGLLVQPTATTAGAVLSPERVEGLECTAGLCDVLGVAGLTDDERVLVHVRTDEGARYYRARVRGGEVTAFRRVAGPSAVDRTANVRTDADTVREVWAAEDRARALRRAVRADRITVDGRGAGLVDRGRVLVANLLRVPYELASGWT